MKTYFIEPGDWEAATSECLPSGSEGIEVVAAAEAKQLLGAHEAFGEWLSKQIDDADAAYRKRPVAEMAIRALALKHVASKQQAFLRHGNQQEEA
jgi:hypothetical protein